MYMLATQCTIHNVLYTIIIIRYLCCSVLQCVAVCCSVLQCITQKNTHVYTYVCTYVHLWNFTNTSVYVIHVYLWKPKDILVRVVFENNTHAYIEISQCVALCCGVLRCVAASCSVLQCVAVCCSMLQCVAVCCSVLQCVAVCCSVLQCIVFQKNTHAHIEISQTIRL